MVLLLFVILLSLAIFVIFFLRIRNETHRPPGPPGIPFIGNLHQLGNTNPHLHLWKLSKQYGPLMFLRLGSIPTLVVSSANIAKEVLKNHDLQVSSRPSLVGQQKLSYNGLDVAFTPYGEYWREIRKICVLHLFNSKHVQSFRSIREDEVMKMIKRISSSASSNKIINLSSTSISFTSNLICKVAFGKRCEEEEEEESSDQRSRFHELLNEAQAMLGTFFFSDYFPLMGWVDRLSGLLWRLEKNFKEFDIFYQQLIDEHLDPNRPNPEQHDIIDVLLRIMKNPNSFSISITFAHIKAILMNIFIAGTDTSAATLVWAMTELSKNPRVMNKVQEEIRNIHGEKSFINEDDTQELPYLKAVIKETFRLYMPAPLLVPRETTQSCNIEGYVIQPKTLVYINAWAIGRDPEVWENPEEFYPERFLGSSIDFRGKDFELIPFGAGRRICPGIEMGAVTVDLALANLLHVFDWELSPGTEKEDIDNDVIPGITMHKKNALCLVAKNCI
ncbi:Cytochrome P450 [Quillaja saponaria]|uniref:Cytochrome P450 n=1 Tax=Quillaja saponaria TaxID=32244 RepID=A0AAD7PU20_QUISA|nr:Cytochrome P450 [Quillaja saponaria]